MRSMPVVIAVTVGGLLLTAAPAAADPATDGGCQRFGANVASLGQNLGPVFGATASGAARAFPQAFPTLVVFPEQQALCS